MSQPSAKLAVTPRGPLDAAVRVPGSKSITNRAMPLAFLAEGDSILTGCLRSDDTDVMCNALRALGSEVEVDGTTFRVSGQGPGFPPAVPTTPVTPDLPALPDLPELPTLPTQESNSTWKLPTGPS